MKTLLQILVAATALQSAEIRLETVGGNSIFRVTNVTDGKLAVAVDQPGAPEMLGTTTRRGNDMIFAPRFPLTPGMRYRATWSPAQGAALTLTFEISKPAAAATTVVQHVYPSSAELPENLLKLYIHFSAPMAKGEVYKHVRLVDSVGKEVEGAFLELDEELWDPSGKRVTLLFDPGRIKRGVALLDEVGGALRPGSSYLLVIDSAFQDEAGNHLATGFEKAFRVVKADRTSPDPNKWRVIEPPTGSSTPVEIQLNEPMDEALLQRMITVRSKTGRSVPGKVTVSGKEMRFEFQPSQPWTQLEYEIVVDTALEDVAGNKIGRLFDVDTLEEGDNEPRPRTVTLPFRPAAVRP